MSQGVIYVLTNPSFPEYVKIGYADDLKKRLAQLNRSECLPFAFRVYCTYEVEERLKDKDVHSLIDKLNPELRAIETFEGKPRVREFYNISAEDAYEILHSIASISGTTDRLKKIAISEDEERDEIAAKQNEDLASGVYTEEMHLEKASAESKRLYCTLKEKALALGDIIAEPKKLYMVFKTNGKNVFATIMQRNRVKVIINLTAGSLYDPEGFARDVANVGHWSTGDYEFELTDVEMIDYLISLIKQSYDAQVNRV